MSFINYAKFELPIGNADLKKFVDAVIAELESGGSFTPAKIKKAIKTVIDSNLLSDTIKAALQAYIDDNLDARLVPLFKDISEIASKSEAKRQLGWPAKEWTKEAKQVTESQTFQYKLTVEGEAVFYIDSVRSSDTPPAKYGSSLRFRGGLGGSAGGSLIIPKGALNASANASISRDLSYQLESKDKFTGIVLAEGVSLLTSPADATKVAKKLSTPAFNGTKLKELKLSGAGTIGGEVGVAAKLPTQYGTFGLNLSGELRFDSTFTTRVSRGGNDKKLLVKYDRQKVKTEGFNVGITYVVGLSTLFPEEAQKLLSFAKETHEIIVKIDDVAKGLDDDLGTALVTWLKPGDLIKGKLESYATTALKKVQAGKPDDLTVLGGLAGVLGVNLPQNVNVEKAIGATSTALAELLTSIIDERIDILTINSDKIANDLRKVFSDVLTGDVIDVLDTEVFSKVKTEIDDRLKALAEKVDAEAGELVDAIDAELGGRGQNSYEKIRNFITESRKLSKKLLDGVTKAQTDLLAAEIGFEYAAKGSEALNFGANFDVSKTSARVAYKKIILKPGEFANLLIGQKTIDGVKPLATSLTTKFSRKTGQRWSLAFIGIPIGYSEKRLIDLEVSNSIHGVQIEAKNAIIEEQRFWKESRSLSFMTCMNVLQARKNNVSEDKIKDVGAPLTMGLTFEDKDPKKSERELRKLLKNFGEEGVVDKNFIKKLVSSGVDQIKKAGRKDSMFTISIGLAVPPSALENLLNNYAAQMKDGDTTLGDTVISATANALITSKKENIRESLESAATISKFSELGLRLEKPKAAYDISDSELAEVLIGIYELGEIETRLALAAGPRGGDRRRKEWAKNAELKRISKTLGAVKETMDILAELYTSKMLPPTDPKTANYVRAQHEFESYVKGKQKLINSIMGPMLGVGASLPWPLDYFGDVVPHKTVILFKTLQDVIAEENDEVIPPILVTMKTADGVVQSFIAARPA